MSQSSNPYAAPLADATALGLGPEPADLAGDKSPAPAREQRKALTESLAGATSWREYVEAAESFGFEVQAKGRGLVLVQDGAETKSSDLSRDFGRERLERQFGQTFKAFEASDERVIAETRFNAAVEIERAVTALEDFDRAESYATDLFVQRQEVLARTEDSFLAVRQVRETRARVEGIAGELYQRPAAALENFDAHRREVGTARAVRDLIEKPKDFGKTKGAGVLGFGGERFKEAVGRLRNAGREYAEAVAAVSSNRAGIDADLKERFDKAPAKALKAAQENLAKIDRGRAAADLLKAVDQIPKKDLAALPFRTPLRRKVILDRVDQVRAERPSRKGRRWPQLPKNATLAEARAFGAAEKYAKARHKISQAVPWRSPNAKASKKDFAALREAAQALSAEGKGAGRYYSRFGIDKRTLQADTFAGAPKAAEARKNAQMSAFMKSKSPKIRARFTTILRMLGVPIPRIPIPRAPRMPVQSNGKMMIRELSR